MESYQQGFFLKWNFPNCIGAIDGKHIVVQAPKNSGSMYFNYKGTFSIVLLAVCDAHYRFILIDLGEVGRRSDGGIFSNSGLAGLWRKTPCCCLILLLCLELCNQVCHNYVIVGDEAFPLRNYLLHRYPCHDCTVFNYRLSRARKITENSFRILAARWRLFWRPIIAQPQNVVKFAKAAIALHNSASDRIFCLLPTWLC